MTRRSLLIRVLSVFTILAGSEASTALAVAETGGTGCWYSWAPTCPEEGIFTYCRGLNYNGPEEAQRCELCRGELCQDTRSISCCNW
jgi:hypothetical protein